MPRTAKPAKTEQEILDKKKWGSFTTADHHNYAFYLTMSYHQERGRTVEGDLILPQHFATLFEALWKMEQRALPNDPIHDALKYIMMPFNYEVDTWRMNGKIVWKEPGPQNVFLVIQQALPKDQDQDQDQE